MVLVAAQTTTFFEHQDQMGIPHDTVIQLQQDKRDSLTLMILPISTCSLQNISPITYDDWGGGGGGGGGVPDANPTAEAGAMIPTPPFVFGVKLQMRLSVCRM